MVFDYYNSKYQVYCLVITKIKGIQMLRNFLTALFHFRTASLLNLMGLATAYVALIVIGLQVITEYSHDKTYPGYDRIYRIERPSWSGGMWGTTISRPIINAIVSSSPEIEESAIIRSGYSFRKTDKTWNIQGSPSGSNPIHNQVLRMSKGFPEMFGMKILAGEGLSDDPDKVIIPRSMVEQYFGDESPLGKVLEPVSPYDRPVTVSGVYEDFPLTSSFANNLYCNAGDDQLELYNYMNYELFVKLRNGTDTSAFIEKLNRVANQAYNAGRQEQASMRFRISKFSDTYFATDIQTGNIHIVNSTSKLKLFALMALFIMFIAAINYINFAMALVPARMQSINMRKMLGASVTQLRGQLVGEAVGMSLMAYLIAVGIVINFETLDRISFIPTTVYITANLAYFGYLGLLAIGLGIIAGIYPAFYSTSFKVVYVLKGSFSLTPKGRMLRTILVGFQFVISTGLIVSAMFMNLQFSMIRNQDLGVNKENILQMNVSGRLAARIDALKSALSTVAGIKDITFTPEDCDIVADNYSCYAFGKEEELRFSNIHGINNMVDFFGLKVVEGRDFTPEDDQKAPNNVILINRSAQKKYNLKIGDRLGQLQSVYNGYNLTEHSDKDGWEVVGVVADFNFKPLYENISPLIIINYGRSASDQNPKTMFLKIQTDDYQALIEKITATFKGFDPNWVADVSFIDQRIEQLYKDDLRSTSLIGGFSLLAIFISLAGVFGLVLFEVRYRRKEIGIRKINGASMEQILSLLSCKFMLMAVVCYVIATPISIHFVGEWLKGFAYRTPLHWWVFVLAMVVMLTLVLLTVMVQSFRTAKENPINSVKAD